MTGERTLWGLVTQCFLILNWYYFTKCFDFRGHQEQRQLKVGDKQLKIDTDIGEYIKLSEGMTKQGTEEEKKTREKLRVYATNNKRDPVELCIKCI